MIATPPARAYRLSMAARVLGSGIPALVVWAGLAGCSTLPPPRSPPQPVVPVASINEGTEAPESSQSTTRSFFVRGNRYPVGQAALLRVCVTPQGAISTVEVVRSSGEPGFDEFAMVWARQADVSGWVRKDQVQEACGSVRVEIGHGRRRLLEQGADTALG